MPEDALDECEKSYEAADEKKKTQSVKFDDTGLMALVCHHDIILFLANVDTIYAAHQRLDRAQL